jgi:phage terminase Nu1 subunit (DNA packaging protein)
MRLESSFDTRSSDLEKPRAKHLLNSWKEIATYLNRGVRTVQRWEAELGLPVHRPRSKRRSAVIAFRSELDSWLRNRPPRQPDNQDVGPGANVQQLLVQMTFLLASTDTTLPRFRTALARFVRELRGLQQSSSTGRAA